MATRDEFERRLNENTIHYEKHEYQKVRIGTDSLNGIIVPVEFLDSLILHCQKIIEGSKVEEKD